MTKSLLVVILLTTLGFINQARCQEPPYIQKRQLATLDEEYKDLQSRRARLSDAIDTIPSNQEISALQIDQNVLEAASTLPTTITEFLKDYDASDDNPSTPRCLDDIAT